MDCLNGLIKMQPCEGERESGVMYLTDLPQISEDAINAAVEAKNPTATDLISNKISFAQKIVADDVMNYYRSKVEKQRVIESDVAGKIQDNMRHTAPESGRMKGINVRIKRRPFLKLYISKINLFLDTSITSTISVYDLNQNKLLDEIDFTSIAGEVVTVDVNKYYKSNKQQINLLFAYNAGLAGNYRTASYKNINCTSCTTKPYCPSGGHIEFRGASIADGVDKTYIGLRTSSDFHGMSIEYSLDCDTEAAVCLIKNQIQLPFLYKVAEMLATEMTYSKRNNSAIDLFKSDHKELAKEFAGEYEMRMFGAFNEHGHKLKQGLLDQLPVPDDVCFKCGPAVYGRVRVP